MHTNGIFLILRGVQALFTVVVLGLTAYVTSYFTTPQQYCDDFIGYCSSYSYGEPAVWAFLLFTTIWSILTLVVLVGVSRFVEAVNHPIAAVVLDAVATLFWFSAAVATAAQFADSIDPVGDADIAMAFIVFALFVATLVLNILRLVRGEGSGSSSRNKNYSDQNPELQHI